MTIRVEQYDGGDVLYIALDPDGVWARSEFPDELVTVDYNAQGGVIGIEVIGSLAQLGTNAVFSAIVEAAQLEDSKAVKAALKRVAA